MANHSSPPAKQPHIAWRIARVVLHILGIVCLWALVAAGTLALIIAIAGSIFMTKFSEYLRTDVIPEAEEYAEELDLDNIALNQTSIIYYQDSETGEYRELQQIMSLENRIWVGYDEIPQDMINAAIAIEDKRFREHDGVDWLRTLSAVNNFIGGSTSFGASTITQQLIKNISQDDDVTIHRKVQEIFRALAVERRYTKAEIMEYYLNAIYLGSGCYGVQSAAQVYFAKDVSELSAAECASIIAITNNPSLYSPYTYPEYNRKRQVTILDEMYAQGYFASEAEYRAALEEEMVFHNGRYDERTYLCAGCGFDGARGDYTKEDGIYHCPNCGTKNYSIESNSSYSYFVDTVYRDVVSDLMEKYGITEAAAQQKLLTGGYSIYSTIRPEVQAQLDNVYQNLDNVPSTRSIQQLQSSCVIVDNETGDIIALVGGVGEKDGSLTYNRATAKLSTGSSIKPLSAYAPALDAGLITPATAIEDSPLDGYDDWPQNYYRNFSGMCLVQYGVQWSLNTISAKTVQKLGLDNSFNFMTQNLGFTTLVDSETVGDKVYSDRGYSALALGELTYGLTVREMAQAYATFPNGGTFRQARTYTQVVDSDGNIILDNAQESHTAVSAKTAKYINYMLQYAVEYGTSTAAVMNGMTVAGKTGTSTNNQNYWFAGYTPYYTAVVWCGYDQPEQVITYDGGSPAIPMWNKVMRPLHSGLAYSAFDYSGMQSYEVCADCGMLATEACKKEVRGNRTVRVLLATEDCPQTECTCHKMVKICKESGRVANEYCEHAHGNSVTEQGMLVFNKDWKVRKDEAHVYNEEEAKVCTVHTASSVKPEPTDSPTPTEPEVALPPDETQWYEDRRIRLY